MNNRRLCENKEIFIKNLRAVNERAEVEPDIIDLVEAYARLRLDQDNELRFYDNKIRFENKKIQQFINKNSHFDNRVLNFLSSYFMEMDKRGLKCILNSCHLAHILGISRKKLDWLADDRAGHYVCFHTEKRDGAKREIFAPKPYLKRVQRQILDELLHRVRLNGHSEGFRKKRSVVTNAVRHIDKAVVIKMDVKGFFPSISFERVLGMFVTLGYPRQTSLLMTRLVTHNGKLPTGAPTSPAISNIICRRMDKRFSRLGQKMEFEYSRYADDITVSSNNKKITRMLPFFKEIVKEEGFAVNEAKTRILRSGRRQKITGIVVNKRPNIAREEIKRLRAVIHNCGHKDIRQEMVKWAKNEKKLANPHNYTISVQAIFVGKNRFCENGKS
jgi:retron-type reverse transcriptase